MNDRMKLAADCWKVIKDNLEDRSVLELGSVDAGTQAELEAEQIKSIDAALAGWGHQVSPYQTRD